LRTARVASEAWPVVQAMVEIGNPNSVTDAGVGALCLRAAVLGAVMNVRVNASGIKDKVFTEKLLGEANQLEQLADLKEKEIRALVNEKLK